MGFKGKVRVMTITIRIGVTGIGFYFLLRHDVHFWLLWGDRYYEFVVYDLRTTGTSGFPPFSAVFFLAEVQGGWRTNWRRFPRAKKSL